MAKAVITDEHCSSCSHRVSHWHLRVWCALILDYYVAASVLESLLIFRHRSTLSLDSDGHTTIQSTSAFSDTKNRHPRILTAKVTKP